jgi:hypothetical protein
LIEALAVHPGIGALLVRSASGHALVVGPHGRLDLTASRLDASDLVENYGPRAVENLLHLDRFANAGDVILIGAVDLVSREVTGFEELIGSHGGLGGWQGDPFILCPATLHMTKDPLVGAPAVYRQLKAWQRQMQSAHGDQARSRRSQ